MAAMKVQTNIRIEEQARNRLRLIAASRGEEIGDVIERLVADAWDVEKRQIAAATS